MFQEQNDNIKEKDQELNINDIIKVLFRRKKIFISALIAVIIVSVLYLFTTKKIYQSNVKIVISIKANAGGATGLASFDLMDMGAVRNIETQIEVIRSRPVIEAVIKKFDLRGSNGEYLQSSSYLAKYVKVDNKKSTDIINITVYDTVPKRAKEIADEIAKLYIEQDTKLNIESARKAREFIEKQIKDVKIELAKSEEDIKRFKESNKTVEIDIEAQEGIKRISEIQTNLLKARALLSETRAKSEEIQSQLKRQNPNFEASVTFANNPLIQEMKSKLVQLETERTKLLQDYNSKHPDVLAVESQIKKIKQDIAKEMKMIVGSRVKTANPIYQNLSNEYVDLQSQEYGISSSIKALERLIEEEKTSVATLPAKEQNLAKLLRIKAANEKAYVLLLERYQEYKIAEAANISSAQVIEPADLPTKHIKPKRSQGLVIAVFIGIILGACLSFIAELIDNTVKTKDDIENLGLRVIGLIPRMEGEEIDTLFTSNEKNLVAAETFRNIRSNINFFSLDNPVKAIIVTSSTPNDGKTFISLQISKIMAKAGSKVLLMGMDLRNPGYYDVFDIPPHKGLSTYISGEVKDDREVIFETGWENLKILPAGPVPPNPAEMLQSKRAQDLIEKLKLEYNIIIMDTPPMPFISDALAITHKADAIIMVASYGHTHKNVLKDSFETIKQTGANILGIILNNVERKKEGYGYGRYGAYGYGKSGYGRYGRYGRKPELEEKEPE